MYITRTKKTVRGKDYQTVLLVRSVRKNGLPRHETLLNLTQWDPRHVEALEASLKGKKPGRGESGAAGKNFELGEVETATGKSIGGLLVAKHLARQEGIMKALGTTEQGKLAMVLIAGRLLTQGSRLKLCDWQEMNEVKAVLGVDRYTEDDLYAALDWLSENQAQIEQRLFEQRYPEGSKKPVLFLYDITSSYVEGDQNELAQYGYNRDGKKGKKQIVIGLLTDQEGDPVSVEVFEGNRADSTTVTEQVEKMASRFGVTELVLVGDKGMIKSTQIKAFKEHTHYITSITREQIKTLIGRNVIQLGLFDNEVVEVEDEGVRYIFRKNPIRAKEMGSERQARVAYLNEEIKKMNLYLYEHPNAKLETQVERAQGKLKRFKLASFCEISTQNNPRILRLEINEEKARELAQLDGCYVLKTDVSKEVLSTQNVHARYKDLAKVESAFRTIKTGWLELRPIYVRKESRTRGHVFVTMLAYSIARAFSKAIKPLDLTVDTAWDYVAQLQTAILSVNTLSIKKIQTPTPMCTSIFKAIALKLPTFSELLVA